MTNDQETIDKLVTCCCDNDLFREQMQDGKYYCVFKPEDLYWKGDVKCEYLNLNEEIHCYGLVYFKCENNGRKN